VLPEEWPRARSVLTEALRVPTGDRTRFIEDAFPNNPRIWDELLAILDGYDKATHSIELAWSEDPEFNKLLPSLPAVSISAPTPAGQATALLSVGQQYGSYRVIKELRPGGMGQVFLAEDVRMPRRVVLKCLAGKWLASPSAHQRLRREANAACVLNHGNIATLYDVVEDNDQMLLVFEYVEGRTLRELLADGRVPVGLALRLAIQVTDAISYAHNQGIFHCDIKPENVQVTGDRDAKVLDFGLARVRFDPEGALDSERGKLLGTPGYMAPERLIRGTLNASGDIYCVGVVLFELLTGRHPYPERGPAQLLAVLGTDAPRPSTLVADLPPELDEITSRTLSRDPRLRYQSARELGRDLKRVLAFVEGSSTAPAALARAADAQKPRRDPTFWLLAGVAAVPALLIVLAVAGFATLIMYDSPLGRTGEFQPESPLWWPWRGFESLLAPTFVAVQLGVLLAFVQLAIRLLTIGPIGRALAPATKAVRRTVDAIRSQPVAILAPTLLFLQLVVVALSLWRFEAVFGGLDSFITKRPPADLAALRPENRAEQNLYTKTFSWQVAAFGLAWYLVLAHRRRRGEREGLPVITAGVAVTVFSLLTGQIFPRQIIYKNKHERVTYDSRRCYVTGQSGGTLLLFCPHQPPPWNQIVKADDPSLKREGAVESIFSGFDGLK
jgi:serine/threonine-protein kinase